MDPAVVKRWIEDNIGDASRAPVKVLPNKRTLKPYMGFNKGGVIVIIYRDANTQEYYAQIADKELGFFPETLTYDELLTRIAERYAVSTS